MAIKHLLCCGAAVAAFSAQVADAATINLIDLGGVAGSPAEQGFLVAAHFWGSMLTNDAVINLGVGFSDLGPGIIAQAGSRRADLGVQNWQNLLNASKSNSALDQSLVLPTLTNGGISFIGNGTAPDGNNDTGVQVFINGTSTSSRTLYANTSLIKAIGGTVSNPGQNDAELTFSSSFGFDFDPRNGVDAGTFDFIGVAVHEIGHALGFVSGVDFYDFYGYPNGPGGGALGYDLNNTSIFSALDMFRYSGDPNGIAPGGGPSLDLTVGTNSYFSIDGGLTALFGNGFSTGAYNGDGRQASHWKEDPPCNIGDGIMDPTFCFGQLGVVTSTDLAAFDAFGWNLSIDALANGGAFQIDSGQMLDNYLRGGAVPEPSTWAMLIIGFGFIGVTMRRRARADFRATS
jgi:hypothetical protein